MPSIDDDFARYCCELLASVGPLRMRRMFGGWSIGPQDLTLAIVADLGDGFKLWLKASPETQPRFEAAGCARFSYAAQGKLRSMGYYSAPEAAMESAHEMAPWAQLALQAALAARSKPAAQRARPSTGKAKPTPKPKPKR